VRPSILCATPRVSACRREAVDAHLKIDPVGYRRAVNGDAAAVGKGNESKLDVLDYCLVTEPGSQRTVRLRPLQSAHADRRVKACGASRFVVHVHRDEFVIDRCESVPVRESDVAKIKDKALAR
jgi:hypothetical protein